MKTLIKKYLINFKKKRTLNFRLSAYFSILLIAMCIISIGIIYFWSYYYFNHLFEDKVIEMYTSESNQTQEVKDEWILGVNAHSIDLVEAIHGSEVAGQIYEDAKNQLVQTQYYKKEIADKYLMYMIEIDDEIGEKVYKYSIIKDIYKEVFPKILVYVLISMAFILMISAYVIKIICTHLTSDMNQIGVYANKIAHKDWNESIEINTNDEDVLSLVNAFDSMRKKLVERDELQQSMLQYVSHELKTPIMIISSYAQAAKDNIYPGGNLESTLDTVLLQTDRIERKVEDLLFIAQLDKEQVKPSLTKIDVAMTISKVMENFKAIKDSKPNINICLNLNENLYLLGYEDTLEVAFENILENQLRYANELIVIRSYITEDMINILFYNDGERIEIENSNHLFQPFEKGVNGKYGLGLSICKRVFELHKGNIIFVPTVKGCMFKVEIPKLAK